MLIFRVLRAQTAIGNGYFGVGLDLFLGADSRFYPALTATCTRIIYPVF